MYFSILFRWREIYAASLYDLISPLIDSFKGLKSLGNSNHSLCNLPQVIKSHCNQSNAFVW